MSNNLRTRDGLPFNFEDGLKVKGVELSGPDGASQIGVSINGQQKTIEDVLIEHQQSLEASPDASIVIGDLTSADLPLQSQDLLLVEQSGLNKKMTVSVVRTELASEALAIKDETIQVRDATIQIKDDVTQLKQDVIDIAENIGTGTVTSQGIGRQWTVRSKPENVTFTDVIWVNTNPSFGAFTTPSGRFIGVSSDKVHTSHDGLTWVLRQEFTGTDWNKVLYFPLYSTLYLFGSPDDGGIQINKSEDYGNTWTNVLPPQYPVGFTRTGDTLGNWKRGAWSASLDTFIIGSGETNLDDGVFLKGQYVDDPVYDIVWTVESSPNLRYPKDIIYSEELNIFVAVGVQNTNGNISTSVDGLTWTARTTPNVFLKSVAWSPLLSLFVAVGTDANNAGVILKSANAIDWTVVPITLNGQAYTSNPLNRVLWVPYKSSSFFIVTTTGENYGNHGLYYSTNAQDWIPVFFEIFPDLREIAFSNDLKRLYLDGPYGNAFTSP